MKRRDRVVVVAVALGAALLGFGLVAYVFSGRTAVPANQTTQQPAASMTPEQPGQTAQPARTPEPASGLEAIFPHVFEPDPAAPSSHPESWMVLVLRIIWRLALAALLAATLAFRPRKDLPIAQRNLYVAQTQILLAVVASSLMMVVGDNAARAFGIFAAVSLVRFRTNIRDPKEITVLLISLSLGLATGVGRWELALILTAFVLPLLWLLERGESEQVFRAMELTIKTRDTERTQEALREIFKRYGIGAEMRQLDPPDEKEPVGCIMYHVQMSLNVSTDDVNDEMLAADPTNIEGIEWDPQKNTGYVYN